jgi:hypothetical protein
VIAPKYWARYNNSFKRWVSPANFYKDWLYFDGDGISSYNELFKTVSDTNKYYINNNTILVDKDQLSKKTFLNFIPKNLKNFLKKILSYIFPKNIG